MAAGAGARTQAARMLQVLIAGSAAVAAAVRPQVNTCFFRFTNHNMEYGAST